MKLWTQRKIFGDISVLISTNFLQCRWIVDAAKHSPFQEKHIAEQIQFPTNCCAMKSSLPISTLAGDLNGCQVQRIVFPFDCCVEGEGRNQWRRTRQQLGLQGIRGGNGMNCTYSRCRRRCMIIDSMEGNTHNYSLRVTNGKGRVAVETGGGVWGMWGQIWETGPSAFQAQEDFLLEHPAGWTCQLYIWQSRKQMLW